MKRSVGAVIMMFAIAERRRQVLQAKVISAGLLITMFTSLPFTTSVDARRATGLGPALPSTSRTEKLNGIPEVVAYEILFRVAALPISTGLLQRGAFSESQIEAIQKEARSAEETLQIFDRNRTEIEKSRASSTHGKPELKLAANTRQKNEFLTKEIDRYLPTALSPELMDQMRSFIQDVIKANTKVVYSEAVPPEGSAETLSSTPPDSGEAVFLFAAGWQDGMSMHSVGILVNDGSARSIHRITSTLTSSGSPISKVSDWSSGGLTGAVQMALGADHIFKGSVLFEQRQKSSDDVLLKIGKIDFFLEEKAAVALKSVTPNAARSGGGENGTFTVSVASSGTVPPNTLVQVEFTELSNIGNISYSIAPKTRTQTVKITDPGGAAATATFQLTAKGDSPAGTVNNQVRIYSVPAGITVTNPSQINNISYTIGNRKPSP